MRMRTVGSSGVALSERSAGDGDSKEDDDAQGKAGGLGEVDMHTEDTGAPYTKKWDMQIRMTAANVSVVSFFP